LEIALNSRTIPVTNTIHKQTLNIKSTLSDTTKNNELLNKSVRMTDAAASAQTGQANHDVLHIREDSVNRQQPSKTMGLREVG
jgi:hypothetical protein